MFRPYTVSTVLVLGTGETGLIPQYPEHDLPYYRTNVMSHVHAMHINQLFLSETELILTKLQSLKLCPILL